MEPFWKEDLQQQFGASIGMLKNAVEKCPEELWGKSMWNDPTMGPEFSEFWYVAYHTLFWLDLYLGGAVGGFHPPTPFTLDELDPAGLLPERPYRREVLLTYLEHCRQKCHDTIEALDDRKAQRICRFTWGEISFWGLLLDNMRHVQEHGAQLNMFLGQEARASSRWISKAV